jgi:hypothetical protein
MAVDQIIAEIYCHFTCDDEPGPFQWIRVRPPFFSSSTAPGFPPTGTWAPQGAPFLLVALHKLRHGVNDSVRGPKCPVPPVVADSERAARCMRLFHFSEWICISQNFSDRRARAAPTLPRSRAAWCLGGKCPGGRRCRIDLSDDHGRRTRSCRPDGKSWSRVLLRPAGHPAPRRLACATSLWCRPSLPTRNPAAAPR